MKILQLLFINRLVVIAFVILGSVALHADGPQVIETSFADRPAVKAEVERIFALPSDISGIENLSMSNPASQSVLVLSSFGEGVSFMATIYEKEDDEVQADTEEWISDSEAPSYVEGTRETILNSAKETALKQILSTAEIDYVVEYLVNYNSENEVAAYEKILRSRIKKSDEPAASAAIMDILDNVFDYDWQQTTTKRVVIPPAN